MIHGKLGQVAVEIENDVIARSGANHVRTDFSYREELFELAFRFLSSPWGILDRRSFEARRIVLRLVLNSPISYRHNEGIRTQDLSMPFRALVGRLGEKVMAHPRGFEPLASTFGGHANGIEGCFFCRYISLLPGSVCRIPGVSLRK